ncbi:MAG TPA: 4a-hydroxytetrahydrobiopterin dehydratase [Candidatus Eisenbacteria bacterium]|nr:4a-hydroxytetrahydrobiopterin dehydratase [Candidatus Eisenbacteria bacterium]
MDLRAKRCLPCEGGVPKLDAAAVALLLPEVPEWEARDDRLHRRFVFKDFVEAMRFVNRMADVAEAEGHHPDFTVHYRQVDVVIWTHAVGGLSENDFILAAKIDAL